jgi:phosphoglycolate phosphatase
MSLPALPHLIFDLDGTLTDPREGITRSIAHALETLSPQYPELGVRLRTMKELERFIGPPIQEVFSELMGTKDPLIYNEAVTIYRERFTRLGLYENMPYPGIHEALENFKQAGHKLWVCTSKPWPFAERILEHFKLSSYFERLYGCEFDGTRSVKIELLAYLLARERFAPASAVMIGDRKHDVAAARANGVHSIGVLYGFGDEIELTQAGAEVLCASVAQLAQAVAGMSKTGAARS